MKIQSNNGNTLTISIVIMVVLSVIAISVATLMGVSLKYSVKSISTSIAKVKEENCAYDILYKLAKDSIIIGDNKGTVGEIVYIKLAETNNYLYESANFDYIIKIDSNNVYTMTVKHEKINIALETTFTLNLDAKNYKIRTWGFKDSNANN